ncbi:hypothetical protein BJX99DRAFT_254437 [Aspergillus californicus]
MQLITTSIEIAASPAVVREKFLDFPSMPKYTPTGFMRSVAPADPSKSPASLQAGDKINCVSSYGKMTFSAAIVENSSREFSWTGSVPVLFRGVHVFRFEEIPGGFEGEGQRTRTKFVQEETFTGLLSGIVGEGFLGNLVGMRKSSITGYNGFNQDFKAWVEGGTCSSGGEEGIPF